MERAFDIHLAPHRRIAVYTALCLAGTQHREDLGAKALFNLRHVLANDLRVMCKYEQAERWSRENLDATSPDNHEERSLCMSELANILTDQAKYPQAAQLFEDAIDILNRAPIESFGSAAHRDTLHARLLNNLSMCRHHQGQVKESLMLRLSALELKTKHVLPGEPDPTLGLAYMNIGASQESLDMIGDAAASLERAVDLIGETVGERHPLFASALNNLGGVRFKQGLELQAMDMYQRAQRAFEEAYGPRHIQVAAAMHNIGWAYNNMRQFDLSREAYEMAIEIKAENYGTRQHPDVAGSLTNLAGLLYERGDFEAAQQAFREEVEIYKAVGMDESFLEAASIAQKNYEVCSEKLSAMVATSPVEDVVP
eukprot:TRINITY_DN6845_c0_g1_i7.p1 TRINITY_DN6845_c0_g1~~TRINITY_DN6845_c0_g1_i7.p1  ORF type:complete len:369 (-),score=86.80 TRINITY_DN6845_c0_g1_i7:381-1487(-)